LNRIANAKVTSEFSKDFAYNGTRGSADIASGFTRGWSTSLGLGIDSTVPLVENLAEEWTNKTIGIYLEPKKAPSGDLPKTGEWKKTGEITFGFVLETMF
jgi:hypothetical protein